MSVIVDAVKKIAADAVQDTPAGDAIDAVKKFFAAASATSSSPQQEEIQDQEPSNQAPQLPDLVGKTRDILERRRNLARRRARKLKPADGAPSDGEMMNLLTLDVRLIPVDKIFVDPDFDYARVHEDPLHPEWYSNEGQHLSDLEETMREEGLKDPVEVQIKDDEFMLRTGTRRWKTAKKLEWKLIPAVVIPAGIPIEWQYWSSVIRNTNRKSLGTYEAALAAKIGRDKYDTKPTDFARKAGYTSGYVFNLLRCIDHLPQELIAQWRDGARVTLDQWITLSHLEHADAIKLYRKWMGFTPIDRLREAGKNARRKPLPPPRWLDRMQRLYVGVEGSDLSPRERDHVLHAIEHCMGMRDGIPDVYEPKKHKIHAKKAELRAQLKLPELPLPGQSKEMPPPRDEVEEDRPSRTLQQPIEKPINENTSAAIEEPLRGRASLEERRRRMRTS